MRTRALGQSTKDNNQKIMLKNQSSIRKGNVGKALVSILLAISTGIFINSSNNAEGRPRIEERKIVRANSTYPLVGAIRWDFWFKGSPMIQKALSNPQWRYRLPFFARIQTDGSVEVNGDNQETVDREILAAEEGGIDYWAFVYFHKIDFKGNPVSPETLKGNLALQRYLSSQYRNRVNHSLILALSHLGTPAQWEQTIDDVLLAHFRLPNYQRVLGDRPLLYMFNMKNLPKLWGSTAKAQAMLSRIREKSKKAGLGNPYIVLMHFSPKEAIQMVGELGYDAVSTYANPVGGNRTRQLPYSYCVGQNRSFREQFRNSGVQLVPTINAGWDTRPLRHGGDPYVKRASNNDFCETATPREIGNHLLETLRWIRTNRSINETNNVLIYAWNEYSEGGWISPTLLDGNARLLAVRRAIDAYRCEIGNSSSCRDRNRDDRNSDVNKNRDDRSRNRNRDRDAKNSDDRSRNREGRFK